MAGILIRNLATNYTAANPTIPQGEFALESDTNKIKLGDGTTKWNNLEYFGSGGGGGSYTAVGGGITIIDNNIEIGDTLTKNPTIYLNKHYLNFKNVYTTGTYKQLNFESPSNYTNAPTFAFWQETLTNGDGTYNEPMHWGWNVNNYDQPTKTSLFYSLEPHWITGGAEYQEAHLTISLPNTQRSRLYSYTFVNRGTLAASTGNWDFRATTYNLMDLNDYNLLGIAKGQLTLTNTASATNQITLQSGTYAANIRNTGDGIFSIAAEGESTLSTINIGKTGNEVVINGGIGGGTSGYGLNVNGGIVTQLSSGVNNSNAAMMQLRMYGIQNRSGKSIFRLLRDDASNTYETFNIKTSGNVTIDLPFATDNANARLQVNGKGTAGTTPLQILGLQTYTDDTAAGTAGLTTGMLYKTTLGQLMVKN